MDYLKINCKPLDNLLGGGIEYNSITEIYGEPGSGKTNICLQASRECASKNNQVVYIYNGKLSLERLKQICNIKNYEKILSKIIFFNPQSFKGQEKIIKKTLKMNNIKLIVLDTFNSFYRLMVEENETYANRSLNRQITDLQIAAMEKNISIIITGQVYTSEKDDVKPFGGRIIERMVKSILKLEKVEIGKRKATIIKHKSQDVGIETIFKITKKGLE
jgi:DNA repair protein RadB